MKAACKRLEYCERDIGLPTIIELFSNADDTLFTRILHNRNLVLQPFYENVLFRIIRQDLGLTTKSSLIRLVS